jgi:subtilisin family serine protease
MKVLNVLLLVLFASSTSARFGSVRRVLEPVGGAIPGQYVVVLDDVVEPRGLVMGLLMKSGPAEILYEYSVIDAFTVRMNINALEHALENIPGVTIYDDPIVTAITVQSPAGSWGIDRVDQEDGLDYQYTYLRDGSNVDVYILDTGIFIGHPDFGNRATYGLNVFETENPAEGPEDNYGHGTHVAGTLH